MVIIIVNNDDSGNGKSYMCTLLWTRTATLEALCNQPWAIDVYMEYPLHEYSSDSHCQYLNPKVFRSGNPNQCS